MIYRCVTFRDMRVCDTCPNFKPNWEDSRCSVGLCSRPIRLDRWEKEPLPRDCIRRMETEIMAQKK